jgi:hypothetical protein
MKGTGHGIAPDGLSVALAFMRDKLGMTREPLRGLPAPPGRALWITSRNCQPITLRRQTKVTQDVVRLAASKA